MSTPTGNPHRYDDMIALPHPISRSHPPMARSKRAAQFAPFDALTGYGAAISEAGRETEEKQELSEDMIAMIETRLAEIQYHIKEQPEITVTYFLPDDKKAGGHYVTASGKAKNLDGVKSVIVMTDGTKIPIGDIRLIEGDLFRDFE